MRVSRDVQEIMTDLMATGLTHAQVVLVVELTTAVASKVVIPHGFHTDSTTEKRRAYDRERYRLRVESRRNPPESAGIQNTPLFLEDKNLKKESKKVRSARIPTEWKLSEVDRKFAVDRRMQTHRIPVEAEKFKNYYISKSGQSATSPDWSAKWRTWVLKALEYQPGEAPPAEPTIIDETIPPAPGLRSSAEIRAEFRAKMATENTKVPENVQREGCAGLRVQGDAISEIQEGNPHERHQTGDGRVAGLGNLFQRFPRV
jgi:hypothetical protein